MYRISLILVLVLLMTTISGCDPQLEDQIPYAFVEIDINLNDSEFFDLRLDGGYVYIFGEGVRGLILYRASEEEYRAFERNSPVDVLNACSTIDVDASGLFMIDYCHNILFDFNGVPISGVAPLMRQYSTLLDRNWLYIRSEL